MMKGGELLLLLFQLMKLVGRIQLGEGEGVSFV